MRIRCFGEARRGPKGLEIVHPEYRRVDPNAAAAPEDHLTPIYPLTEGVTQGRLRMLVGMALDQTGAGDIEDWLPAAAAWPIRACPRCATPCSMCIARPPTRPWIC